MEDKKLFSLLTNPEQQCANCKSTENVYWHNNFNHKTYCFECGINILFQYRLNIIT